ncbi:MAG: hypothetical protein KKH28_01285 [Elusimicrobia bacterium]|nr:hypothetical protein [Elusimicrobiota bacterium]
MKKNTLVRMFLGMGLVLSAASYAFAEDAEVKLNSNDGTTKFIVQDKDAATVFATDSAGNTVINGTAAVAGSGFSVGGSTFVVKAGNVGIGTTAPGAKLETVGEVRTSTSTTSTLGLCLAGAFQDLPTSGYKKGCIAYQISNETLYVSTETVATTYSWKPVW